MMRTPRAKSKLPERPKPRIPLPVKPPKVEPKADAYKRKPKHKKPIEHEPPVEGGSFVL